MTKPNALLNALRLYVERGSDEKITGRCRELPSLVIHGDGITSEQLFQGLRQEVIRRLESGVRPKFNGNGENVFDGHLWDSESKRLFSLSIGDHWCGFTDTKIVKQAKMEAEAWILKVGPLISQNGRTTKVTVKSLTARICKAVKTARKEYRKNKAAWQIKWNEAIQKREQEKMQEIVMKRMVEDLVDEALRYVEQGGRLKVPWAVRERRNTAAETWHLMTPDEFNKRAEPPKQNRTEKRDAEGNVTGWAIRYENQNGGEMMAGGEQTEFMLKVFAKYAEEGDETALRWLHRLAQQATSLFWSSVEQQAVLARRISKDWQTVSVSSDGSTASAKAVEARVKSLDMPPPRQFELKVDPTSRHHGFIVRISQSIDFLLNIPPASTPWTGVDENAPEWLKLAWECTQTQPQKLDLMPEVYWQIYEAAMTRARTSPWVKESRPRKEREKFLKAVKARIKHSAPKTP